MPVPGKSLRKRSSWSDPWECPGFQPGEPLCKNGYYCGFAAEMCGELPCLSFFSERAGNSFNDGINIAAKANCKTDENLLQQNEVLWIKGFQ